MQCRGIGAELVRSGLQLCRTADTALVVVLGDHHYYSRFGFTLACDAGLDNEYGAYAHFMVLALRVDALTAVSGMVRYAVEFKQAGC